MSAYIYAIIPYKSGLTFSRKEPIPCVYNPYLPELKSIDSEFIDEIVQYSEFIMINTCYRQSAFIDNRDGYCWIRSEICQIARALGANEVWYVEENITDEMEEHDFSFEDWARSLREEKKQYVVELTVEVLKGEEMYDYYHDDFSDVIMERHPPKTSKRK